MHYRQRLNDQQRVAQLYNAQLQQQNRMAEYRYQQQYVAHMQQQQIALQRSRNYNNDPYYYTAPIYRYNRGGSYYETNQYGANSLRQAVNYGYSQGYQSGQAAREDRYSSGYQNSYAYQDANYGYDGYTSDKPITTIISDRVSAGVMRMAITLVINTANTQAVRTAS